MKKLFTSFLMIAFLAFGFTQVNAQNRCGTEFTVICDADGNGGTLVNAVFASDTWIFKVFDGGNVLIELNNYDSSKPNVPPSYDGMLSQDLVSPGSNVWVQVQTLNGACVGSLNISQACANKRDLTEITNIAAYPNPTVSDVRLNLPTVEDQYTVSVYDLSGKVMNEFYSQGGNVLVDMNSLNAGLYILNVESKEYNYTEKVQLLK